MAGATGTKDITGCGCRVTIAIVADTGSLGIMCVAAVTIRIMPAGITAIIASGSRAIGADYERIAEAGNRRPDSREWLVTDNFHQHSLAPAAVEFAVEDLFPRSEVQFAFGDRDDDFAAHDLTLEMGVSIVFAGAIVAVGASRLVRREFFQPDLVIVMKS